MHPIHQNEAFEKNTRDLRETRGESVMWVVSEDIAEQMRINMEMEVCWALRDGETSIAKHWETCRSLFLQHRETLQEVPEHRKQSIVRTKFTSFIAASFLSYALHLSRERMGDRMGRIVDILYHTRCLLKGDTSLEEIGDFCRIFIQRYEIEISDTHRLRHAILVECRRLCMRLINHQGSTKS